MYSSEVRAKGFDLWYGGDEAPVDWDGGEVLLRDGSIWGSNIEWQWDTCFQSDVVGYKRKVKVNDIPDWARDRVAEIIDGEQGKGWHDRFVPIGATNIFATYIAEHEQPPVDPDIAIAKEYYDKWINDDIDSCKEAILAAIKASKT